MLKKISYLSEKLAEIPEVISVVLFGSAATGDKGKKSDIDILVILSRKNKNIEKKIEEILSIDSEMVRIIPVIATQEEIVKNPHFTFDILRDGIILYKNPKIYLNLPIAMSTKPITIYTFDMGNLEHKKRVKLNTALYGATYRKKLKDGKIQKYRYYGVIERVGGKHIGGGVIMIPSKWEKDIEELFNYHKIIFKKLHLFFLEGT